MKKIIDSHVVRRVDADELVVHITVSDIWGPSHEKTWIKHEHTECTYVITCSHGYISLSWTGGDQTIQCPNLTAALGHVMRHIHKIDEELTETEELLCQQ